MTNKDNFKGYNMRLCTGNQKDYLGASLVNQDCMVSTI